jgi:hypothetical protein
MSYAAISLSIVVAALGVELYRCKRKLRAYESPSRMVISAGTNAHQVVHDFQRAIARISDEAADRIADEFERRRRRDQW